MRVFARFGLLGALVLAAGMLLSGCSEEQLKNAKVQQNDDGSVTITVLPAPGENGQAKTVLVPANAIPPSVRARLPPKKPAPPAVKPGNGGNAGKDPSVPSKPLQPTAPPTTVTNPTKPTTGGSPTEKARLESDFGVTVLGKDASNAEYLNMMRQAMNLYPAGSFRGLQVYLDEESLQKTGGVGGVWQMQGGRTWITIYQNSLTYIHVALHELAHHIDLYVHGARATPALLAAATVNGTVPTQNIPSAYAKYGLQSPDMNAEWGAEVISWSLDRRSVPGFNTNATWHPTQPVVDTLGKYVEKSKIIWNSGK